MEKLIYNPEYRTPATKEWTKDALFAWKADAKRAVDMIEKYDGIIVLVKKSTSNIYLLSPAIEQELTQRHFAYATFHTSASTIEEETKRTFTYAQEDFKRATGKNPKGYVIRIESSYSDKKIASEHREMADSVLNNGGKLILDYRVGEWWNGGNFERFKPQQTKIPKEVAKKYLKIWGANDELVRFFMDDQNSALLDPEALDLIFDGLEGQNRRDNYLPYWREKGIKDLEKYFSEGIPFWMVWYAADIGDNKSELGRMLHNLGIDINKPIDYQWAQNVLSWS